MLPGGAANGELEDGELLSGRVMIYGGETKDSRWSNFSIKGTELISSVLAEEGK